MALTLKEFRQKYPQYDKVPDQQLVEGLHRKYYSNVPFDEFAAKIEYRGEVEPPPPEPTIERETTRNPLKGAVARGAELLGSGIETLGRAGEAIGDVIAEKAPILDTRLMIDREGIRLERPTKEEIRDKNQLQYMQDWADSFRNWGREINYEPSTKLGELADNPLNAVPFIVERVITSSPDMVAAAAALPAYIPTRANEILNERLKNDDKSLSEATIGDVAAATSAAVVEATLERFATRRLISEGAEAATTLGRVGKEAAVQAGTEATEEVAAYAGETAGTKAGFDPRTAGLTALEAAIVGGGLGAGAQGVREIFGAGPSEAEPEVTEEVAPVPRPRPAVPAELGAALQGLETTELPPEVIEGVPPAVVDSAKDILTLVDEGKAINLFRARSLARQLGADIPQNANKETTLTALREAVALVAAPPPVQAAEETVTAEAPSVAPEVAKPRRINPFLPLEEQGFAVPEAAQLAPIETITPPPTAELTASNLDEAANLFSDLKPGDKIVNDMGDEFVVGSVVKARKNGPIVGFQLPEGGEVLTIDNFTSLILPQPYTDASTGERKISGSGKLIKAAPVETVTPAPTAEAAQMEPVKFTAPSDFRYTLLEVPNYDLAPLSVEDADFELEVLQQQAERGRLTPQNFAQSEIGTRLDTVQIGRINEGLRTDPVNTIKALREKLAPIETTTPPVEVPSEPSRESAIGPVAEPSGGGVELPVPRAGAAGPEITAPSPARLERIGGAPERVDAGEAPRPAALKKPERKSQGIVDEESPEAIESLRRAEADESIPVTRSDDIITPEWTEAPNGFGYRQYKVADRDTGQISTVQEVRAPVDPTSKTEPAVIRRGLGYDGRPFGEIEATGTLDEVMSGKSFKDFNKYFAAKRAAPATAPKLEVASDVEQELRAKSRAEERPGDVMLGTGQFVAIDDAVKAARAVMTPQQLSSPFQFSKKLDIAPRDWDRMVEATAAPTRIFESIESLNRDIPDLSEQAREQAPSLRRELGKAKKDYDAGKITGDVFAETAGDLLLKTQKERVVRPRVRGADYIRERLLNARRTGALSNEAADLAEWFVRQNPLLVDDLGISIRQQPEAMKGTAGFYNPVSRISTIFSGAGDTQTPVHEILHHLEQLMPANIRANILKAYTKQLTKAAKKAKTDAEIAFFKAIENYQYFSQGDSYSARVNAKNEYNKALSLIKEGKVPKSHYQYASPSEFWAINGSRIVEGRYGIPPGIVGQIKKWLREFLEKAKDLFGLSSDAAIIRALDSLAKADGKYQTRQMLGEAPAYRAIQPPKNLLQVRKAGAKAKKPSLLQKAAQQFEGHNFYKNLVKKFADTTEPIMALDRAKKRSEFLITLGPDRNDIASELVRSPNIADFIIRRRVEPAERRLQEYIKDYARVAGMKPEDAVDKLDSILIAIHEPVRRETKYLRNVGLRNDIRLPAANLPFAAGQPDMTPADYREFLEGLRSKLPPDQAAQIQDVMRVIVDKFKTSRGFSPKAIPGKPTPLDINDKFYDVIPRKIDGKDAYTPQLLRAELNEYQQLTGEQKAAIDNVRAALAKINELERQLGREANYWPPQVDSVIASYQWGDTYVPFQGIPDADDSLDYSSKKLSGELTETAQAWDGRSTDFDSPILQSIDNAKRAAGRVSRKDLVSVTLVNNIKQGFLRAKSIDPEVYTFDDRRAPDFDFSVLQGREKVLDYQSNGDIHVYELKEGDKIDALKRAYRDLNPWLKPINTLTSWFAQYHTRFNPAFAPMDFFTNTMTNLGLITAGEGGVKEGGRYIAQTLSNVARSGLFTKTANLSRVLSSKDPAALDKLLRSGDSFYRDAVDFISRGGLSLQRQALGIDIQREELVNAVGPGLFIKTKDQVFRLFDIYNDMFELTSRLAVYTTHLKDITARAKRKGINVNDPEVQEALKREATTFALESMNFRKMGEYGRILSALYQFFKPGATSAKLAYDAVRKAVISAESELKNTDPAVWARLNSIYELQELEEEQAKPRPDQQKIAELQNAIQANDAAKQKFITNYNMEKKNAALAIPLFFVTGGLYYAIAQMFSPDDDEGRNKIATDEMSRWTRYARMPMPGQEEFFQLPWGYGIGAFAAAGAQTEALRQGNLSFSDYAGNMIEIGLDSFMPFPASRTNPFDNVGTWILGTISPSAARGFIEYTLNLDSLGNPIYNSRLGKYADAYSGTARAGELHNAMADVLFGISEGNINWNPNTIAYAMNTYADGPNVIAESAFNVALRLRDEKDADLKKDIPFIKRFVGRMSNFDAREFSEAERWIRKEAPKYKTFRDIRPPEEYDRYVEKHPTVPIISAMYDNVLNGTLSTLSEQRKLILRNRELTPKERQEYLDDIDYNINAVKRNFVESYKYIREEEDAGS